MLTDMQSTLHTAVPSPAVSDAYDGYDVRDFDEDGLRAKAKR